MHEQVDCPRLFTLEPLGRAAWNPKRWVELDYELTLWCEHPENEHPWDEAKFELRQSREWLVKAAPYIRFVGKRLDAGSVPAPESGRRRWFVVPASRLGYISLSRPSARLYPRR